ncbi:MAG: helix-turn-helix domain-containing protein [Niabella sp.]
MIHEKLKLLRKAKGLTRAEMASLLHKSQNAYCKIEAGSAKIDAELVSEICRVLEIMPNKLFELENNSAMNQQLADYREIIKLFKEELAKKNELLLLLVDTLSKVDKLKEDNRNLIGLLNIIRGYSNTIKE